MYLASETIRRFGKDPTLKLAKPDAELLNFYRGELDTATRFIPTWVKIAVAAQGASAEPRWPRTGPGCIGLEHRAAASTARHASSR